jgi:hypothetical protein
MFDWDWNIDHTALGWEFKTVPIQGTVYMRHLHKTNIIYQFRSELPQVVYYIIHQYHHKY